ncbi:MAG: leucine-rich repeat domain-containing protein [Paludibacter sp.]|nr:MAG: leucine-rich repeat domain-containing protein [Paludibacter sp.]
MKKTHLLLFVLSFSGIVTAQLSKTVDITAGGLSAALTSSEKATVTELIITGSMNSNDFYQIRNYMPLLNKLDMSAVSVANRVINSSAFESKTSLVEVVLPSNLKSIDEYAFYNCNNLKSINLPDSLELIKYSAFYQCYELSTNLVIPPKVRSIDNYAFYKCSKLSSLVCPTRCEHWVPMLFRNADCSAANW